MKKINLISAVLVSALLMAGCGSSNTSNQNSQTTNDQTTTAQPANNNLNSQGNSSQTNTTTTTTTTSDMYKVTNPTDVLTKAKTSANLATEKAKKWQSDAKLILLSTNYFSSLSDDGVIDKFIFTSDINTDLYFSIDICIFFYFSF